MKNKEVRRAEAEGKISNVKVQSPNGEISGRAEKRALSANYIFSATTPKPRAGKNPVLGLRRFQRLNRRKNMFEWRRASFFETS